MTDAELRDAAIAYLKKTTVGWNKVSGYSAEKLAGTNWGKAMDLLGQIGLQAAPSPTAHFLSDWASGKIAYKPWSTIFSYSAPGYQDVGYYGQAARTSSADGRVSIVPNPFGSGNVLRCEIQNADPGWPSNTTLQKAEVGSVKEMTLPSGFKMGSEWWLRMQVALPDEFGLATGGSNAFTTIADLHSSSGSKWPTIQLSSYPSNAIDLRLDGGSGASPEHIPLIPIDAAHRNRMIEIIIGAFLSDTAGWVEAWMDGENVLPRKQRPTVWTDETGPYWKQGLYKQKDASFPNSASVIYFGRTEMYTTRPF